MPESQNKSDSSPLPIPSSVLVGMATGPMLVALLGTKALGKLLLDLGTMSEELLRGDRLPILHFPEKEN
jgi:hypothetical protein